MNEFDINCKIWKLYETITEHERYIYRHRNNALYTSMRLRRIDMIRKCLKDIEELEVQLKKEEAKSVAV